MTRETSPGCTLLSVFYHNPKLIQGIGVISSFGVLSSGIVWARTDVAPDTLGTPTIQRITPSMKAEREPVVDRLNSGSLRTAEQEPNRPRLRPPTLSEPTSLAQETRSNNSSVSETRSARVRETNKAYSNNNVVDSTNYSLGATERTNSRNRSYDAPDSVVLSERSTGCRRVLGNGQGLASGICGSVAGVASENDYTASRYRLSRQLELASRRQRAGGDTEVGLVSRWPVVDSAQRTASNLSESGLAGHRRGAELGIGGRQRGSIASINEVNIGPLRVSANSIGLNSSRPTSADEQNGNSFSSQSFFNTKIPLPVPSSLEGNIGFIYPLSILAPITSIFGWRVHPITGDRRFHAGIDLGAPLGTPVLAAYAGQVALANWMGGYGLAVVLQHDQTQQTLYGHLSEVFVQPGQWVDQGTVIGKVGSTGNSTGPHLHFEWRQMATEGWVARDPGSQLQYATAQMLQALQATQPTVQPGG